MPRHYNRCIFQAVQPLSNGLFDGVEVSAPEIGAPDAAAKECVAGQNQFVDGEMKTHGPGSVAWRMESDRGDLADQQFFLVLEPVIGHRDRRVGNAEHSALQFEILP